MLHESIRIVDKDNKSVAGRIHVGDKERKFQFIPNDKWVIGNYRVDVEPVLEDLAGNNLNRPFDRDIRVKNANAGRTKFEISFEIKK